MWSSVDAQPSSPIESVWLNGRVCRSDGDIITARILSKRNRCWHFTSVSTKQNIITTTANKHKKNGRSRIDGELKREKKRNKKEKRKEGRGEESKITNEMREPNFPSWNETWDTIEARSLDDARKSLKRIPVEYWRPEFSARNGSAARLLQMNPALSFLHGNKKKLIADENDF